MARIVLIIAAIIEIVFRGIPSLLASQGIADLFGLEYIEGALYYIHPFGALMIVFGIMFFIASKDPVKYKILIDMGILRYGLAFLSYFVTLAKIGSLGEFWWYHMILDLILVVLFFFSRPKPAPAVSEEQTETE